MSNCKFTRCLFQKRHYIFNYHIIFRQMCFAKFLPFNLNISPSQRERDVKDLFSIFRPDNTDTRKNILMECLNIPEKDALSILQKRKTALSSIDLIYRINILKDVFQSKTFTKTECEGLLFPYTSSSLHNRIMMMKELGIPITCNNLIKFSKIIRKKICYLQEKGLMDNCTDLPDKLFHRFHAPQNVISRLPSKNLYKDQKLKDFWLEINKIFLIWQLELSKEKSQSKKIELHCQRILSLKNQHEIIQLLRKHLNLGNSKIIHNLDLLTRVPDHYIKYFESNKKLCGVPLIDVVQRQPHLLMRPIEDTILLEQIINYINCKRINRGISNLTLKTVLSRIAYFIRKTSLSDFRLTPNNYYYICYYDHCKKVIKKYEEKKGPIKYLPTITGVYREENSVLYEHRHIMNQVFYFYLGLPPSEHRLVMKQTGLINFPQLHVFKSNFAFLLNNGFSVEDLRQDFQILLFPHDLVVKTYHELADTTKYMKLYQKNDDKGKIIQLLLYKVYKNYQSLTASL